MELTINVEALDKTQSAVVSASDRTALTELQLLVSGNVEPLTFRFCDDDGATPAWVTDATYTVAAGLGYVTADGLADYAPAAAFTISGSTRISTLDLSPASLRTALTNAASCRRSFTAPFVLEIRKSGPTGTIETLGLLPVTLAGRVLA